MGLSWCDRECEWECECECVSVSDGDLNRLWRGGDADRCDCVRHDVHRGKLDCGSCFCLLLLFSIGRVLKYLGNCVLLLRRVRLIVDRVWVAGMWMRMG